MRKTQYFKKTGFMNRTLIIFSAILLFVTSNAFAGEERITASLSGSGIANDEDITVEDQWYDYMQNNQTTWSDRFEVKSSIAKVVFRFDDSQMDYYSSDWDITIEYDLETWDEDGNYTPYNDQELTISYNTAANFTDLIARQYDNVHKAVLTLKGASVPGVDLTNAPNSAVPVDVFLDVEIVTERYYVLDANETTWIENEYISATNELELSWVYIEGAESYDLEWVFVDIGTGLSTGTYNYDFKNATRINVPNTFYRISMAYPKGILVYRVRGVGFTGTNLDERVDGKWSIVSNTGTTDNVVSLGNPIDPTNTTYEQKYYYTGLETDMNWQYGVTYAEDGKRKEGITFIDGSGRTRQSTTILNTDYNAVVGQPIYDYLGRPAVNQLPAPVTNEGMRFYDQLTMAGSGDYYDFTDFDLDGNIAGPTAISDLDSKGAGVYYSDQNTTPMGINGAYTPDAEGYPFSRTRFMNDGSGRVYSQSGVGADFKPGSGKETRYYYSNPTTQEELDRLFGNEVGNVSQYKKTYVVDANGQASVTYSDQSGRTIASALTGDSPANMLNIDTKTTSATTITGDLTGFNHLSQDGTTYSLSNTFMVVGGSVKYTFTYDLDAETSVLCTGTKDCEYDLFITLLDENGNAVTGTTHSYTSITSIGNPISFDPILSTGTYNIIKILSLNQDDMDTYYDGVLTSTGSTCITPADFDAEDCNPACSTMCEEAYKFLDDDNRTVYLDEDGEIVAIYNNTTSSYDEGDANDVSDVQGLIDDCTDACNAIDDGPVYDECEIKYDFLKRDMSSGGQYFNNLPKMFDANGDPEPTYNTALINDWLEVELWGDNDTEWTDANFEDADGNLIETWDDLRANWDDAFADQAFSSSINNKSSLVEFHPEWCAYFYYCGCEVTINSEDVPAYSYYSQKMFTSSADFTDATEDLFNPVSNLKETNYSTTTEKNEYQPFDKITSPTDERIDPLFGTNCKSGLEGTLQTMLEDFYYDGTNYYSLWYVLADPDEIAGGTTTSCGCSQDMLDFFNSIHGDGASITGLVGTGTDQISEYEFFRAAYHFMREYVLYDDFSTNGGGAGTSCSTAQFLTGGTYNGITSDNITSTGFIIRWPQNDIYENWTSGASYFENTYAPTELFAACDDACEAYADSWMDQLTCDLGGNEAAVRANLIALCKEGCSEDTPLGSDDVADGDTGQNRGDYIVVNSTNCYTFSDVLDEYSCTDIVIHPPAAFDTDACECANVIDFLDANGYTVANLATLTTQQKDDLAEELEEMLTNTETFDFDDIKEWADSCDTNGEPPTTPVLPEAFECQEDLTPDLNDYFTNCDGELTTLNTYNEDQANLMLLIEAANTAMEQYKIDCFANIVTNETFTVEYDLDEYHYTLFYYDQAGDLVKTVPPKGVKDNNFELYDESNVPAALSDVADHRSNPANDYIHPHYTFVTNYKYNSLQQIIEQETPDGGVTEFWYDELGRMVLSQNEKQVALTTPRYNYVGYDHLNRMVESGEIEENGTTGAMTYAISRDDTQLDNWFNDANAGDRFEVRRSYYDELLNTTIENEFSNGQLNLRNRISTVSYEATDDSDDDTYDYATHYSYDIHGNVEVLLQEYPELEDIEQEFKRVNYYYDLVSGNVNEVHYQPGKFDEFYHRYCYDADNRITNAYTSSDGVTWEQDNKYFYYAHGPLARTEHGQKQVQACDYTYTIQGWLKGVNSNTLYTDRDPGEDAEDGTLNQHFAKDATGFTLGYYQDDYAAISGTANAFEADIDNQNLFTRTTANLYNGNIGHMVTALTISGSADVQAMSYEYDQLNRLKTAESYTNLDASGNEWNSTPNSTFPYLTQLAYDGNGNIVTLARNGSSTTIGMDDLSYTYNAGTGNGSNQLNHVLDDIISTNYTVDIDGQSTNNYTYDEIGQLIEDDAECIATIEWSTSHKVLKITRDASCQINGNYRDDLEFLYDASDNRVVKIVKPRDVNGLQDQNEWRYTYYMRDASGNVMATYERTYEPDELGDEDDWIDNFTVKEQHVYGSKRSGVYNNENTHVVNFTATILNGVFGTRTYSTVPGDDQDHIVETSPEDVWEYDRVLGNKSYELSNHLGNVLTVVSDIRKVDSYTASTVDEYGAEILSYSDYYPFGMQMPERHGSSDSYRYGFQGQEKDDEVYNQNGTSYTAEFWQYDSRLGRRWNVDPVVKPHESSYATFANNPVWFIDPIGADTIMTPGGRKMNVPAGSIQLGNYLKLGDTWHIWSPIEYKYVPDSETYLSDEYANHIRKRLPNGFMVTPDVIGVEQLSLEFGIGAIGPENRAFLDGHHMTEDLKNARRVNEARRKFYEEYLWEFAKEGSLPRNASINNFEGYFGIDGFLTANFDLTEQFVGGFMVDIYLSKNGDRLIFSVYNETTVKSLTNKVISSYTRGQSGNVPGSTIRQVYMWSEPIDMFHFAQARLIYLGGNYILENVINPIYNYYYQQLTGSKP
jgi:hypothetical protein